MSDDIELLNLSRALEYERQSRSIDKMDLDQAREFAKSYLKLYLKQQEVVLSMATM
jgi:hypothetical protein